MLTTARSWWADVGGSIGPVEAVDRVASLIAQVEPALGAFVFLDLDGAWQRARQLERSSRRRKGQPLFGLPIAVKDVIDVASWPTRNGSEASLDRGALNDAVVVSRAREAGAVLIGKVGTHEFGLATPVSFHAGMQRALRLFGPPAQQDHPTTGGGAAAAVAANLVAAVLDTDTGGSIRIPASFCGVVGLKPTRGLVPRRGVTPISWTLDTVGVTAPDTDIANRVLGAVAGPDPTEVEARASFGWLIESIRTQRLGLPRLADGCLNEPAAVAWERFQAQAIVAGFKLVPVDWPDLEATHSAVATIIAAEGWQNHRDGVLKDARLSDSIRKRLAAGSGIALGDYLSALRMGQTVAARLRDLLKAERLSAFALPAAACSCASPSDSATDLYLSARLCSLFNLAGLPSVAAPAMHDLQGFPVGLQVAGPPEADQSLLSLSGRILSAAVG